MGVNIHLNKGLCLYKEIISIKNKTTRITLGKSLAALIILIAAVTGIIFMHSQLLPYGIAFILMTGVALVQYFNHHRASSTIFSRAARAISQEKL